MTFTVNKAKNVSTLFWKSYESKNTLIDEMRWFSFWRF